jgi:hypothetical protein
LGSGVMIREDYKEGKEESTMVQMADGSFVGKR